MELLYLLADLMVYVILLGAVIATGIYFQLRREIDSRTTAMVDSLRNTLKGIEGVPDYDSTKSVHDEIGATLNFIFQLKSEDSSQYQKVVANTQRQDERKLGFASFRIETLANIGAAMVQIFPLLGILGTILAIAQSASASVAEGGVLDPSVVTSSFAIAMDTTILGIFFGIVFMLVDSTFQAKVSELMDGAEKYKEFIGSVKFRAPLQ